jgi:hypothetical protein
VNGRARRGLGDDQELGSPRECPHCRRQCSKTRRHLLGRAIIAPDSIPVRKRKCHRSRVRGADTERQVVGGKQRRNARPSGAPAVSAAGLGFHDRQHLVLAFQSVTASRTSPKTLITSTRAFQALGIGDADLTWMNIRVARMCLRSQVRAACLPRRGPPAADG